MLMSARRVDSSAELVSPPELHFTSAPEKNVRVAAGRPLQLLCEASGIPPPIIRWVVNGDAERAPVDNVIEKQLNSGQTTIQNGARSHTRITYKV
jgi:hypothetical protein